MSILVIEEAAEAEDWARHLRAALPDSEVLVWPELPDPDAVEMAVVWDDLDALAGLPNLSAVVVLGAGVDHLLGRLDAMPEGVTCLRIVDDSVRAQMVEWVLLALVTHTRRWDDYREQQRAGSYEELPVPVPPDLVVGILGFGVLGRATGELLRDMGYRVRGWSRSPKRAEGIECFAGDEELGTFLSACDVVVCMLPLTAQTEGLLRRDTFAMMKRGAYLINVARGGHVVEGRSRRRHRRRTALGRHPGRAARGAYAGRPSLLVPSPDPHHPARRDLHAGALLRRPGRGQLPAAATRRAPAQQRRPRAAVLRR